MERSDLALIEQIRTGSTVAFEELMSRYERLVYRIGFAYTADEEDSLDLTQAVFLKVYQRLESFRGTGSFKAWLVRLTQNESLDWIRSHARYRGHGEMTYENTPQCEAEQESELARSEVRDRLTRALLLLNPRQQEVIILRYFEGMSIREISSVLSCTEGTAKSLVFRSLQKLRGQLGPQGREP